MRTRTTFALAAIIAIAVVIASGALISRAVRYIDDIHPRGLTRELAEWEKEYHDRGAVQPSVKHAREFLEYVENYYRYEDAPEYRDNDAVKELAKQRLKTMKAIQDWIDSIPEAKAVQN